ncbi:MAG: hypothetical protein ACRELE_12275, partial [Gemmatimonadales bacterium]
RTSAIALFILIVGPVLAGNSLFAQAGVAGTATYHMKMHLPDAVAAKAGSAEVDMQMIGATDGHRFAMDMVMGGDGRMAGMETKIIFTIGGDSVHIGLMMPPLLAAQSGMAGTRMDLPVSMMGAGNPTLAGILDSVSKAIVNPIFRALGTTAVVGGLKCAEWEMVAGNDTTRTCVIPMPAPILALKETMSTVSGMQALLANLPGMAEMQRKAYDGKPMIPLRTTNTRTGMTMEFVSFVPGPPVASAFELPADLRTMH